MADNFGGAFDPTPNVAANRIGEIIQTAPWLKQAPSIVAGLNGANADPEAVAATAGLDQGTQFRSELEAHSGDEFRELSYWNSLSAPQQQLAVKAGYKPILDRRHESLFSKGLGGVFHAVGNVLSGVGGLAKDVGSQALHDIHYVNEEKNRIWRTYQQSMQPSEQMGVPVLQDIKPLNFLSGVFTGDVAKWWHESESGANLFDQATEKRIQGRFTPDIVALARRAAQHDDPRNDVNALITEGDNDGAADLERKLNSQEFKDAYDQYNNAKMSPGRAVSQVLHLEDNNKSVVNVGGVHLGVNDLVSGTIDGVYSWYTDPLIVAANVARAQKVAKYGMRVFEDTAHADRQADTLFQAPAVRKFWDDIGPHLDAARGTDRVAAGEAMKTMQRNFKKGVPLLPALLAHDAPVVVKDAETALQFFKQGNGYAAAMAGNPAFRRPLMPYRTRIAEQVQKLKPGEAIDFLGLSGRRLIHDDEITRITAKAEARAARATDPAVKAAALAKGDAKVSRYTASKIQEHNDSWRGRASSMGRRISTKVPPARIMLDNSKDSVKHVQQLASYVGPKYWARQQAAAFGAADEAGKRMILRGIHATMFEAAAIDKSSVYGKTFAARYLDSLASDAGRYSSHTGADVSPLTGRHVALDPEDARPWVSTPNFAEFWAASAKLGVEGHVAGFTNKSGFDWWTQRVFKPSVLLRPALAIRNSGEENLNYILQHGYGDYKRGRAEFRILNAKTYGVRTAAEADLRTSEAAHEALVASGAGIRKIRASERDLEHMRTYIESMPKSFDVNAGRVFRAATYPVRVVQRAVNLLPDSFIEAAHLRKALNPHLWENAYDWHRAHLMGKVGEKALKRYDAKALTYLDDLAHDEIALQHFNTEMMEDAGNAARGATDGFVKATARGRVGRVEEMHISDVGDFAQRATDNQVGLKAWSSRMAKLLDSKPFQLSFTHWDDETKALDEIATYVDHNWVAMSGEMELLRDIERVMGREAAPREYARRVRAETMTHITGKDGHILSDLARSIARTDTRSGKWRYLDRSATDVEHLEKIPVEYRPSHVLGQDSILMNTSMNPLQELVGNGFQWIGTATAYMSRQAPWVRNYVEARKDLEGLQKTLTDRGFTDEVAKLQVHKRAMNMADERTAQYIDNPQVRSQAAVLMRNLAPFYRAQEEFYARWAKTFKYHPEALEKGMLLFDGAQDSGFVQTDSEGHAYFIYPATGVLSKALAKTFAVLHLPDMFQMPVQQQLTGQVKLLNAGTDPRGINPITGPIVAFPLQLARQVYGAQWLADTERAVLGDQAAGRNPFLSQLPTPIRRAVEAFGGEKQQLAAMKQAAAYLEYAGQAPAPDAPSEVRDAYIDKLRLWSQGTLLMKAFFGMSAPTPLEGEDIAPATGVLAQEAGLATVKDEFRDLVNKVGYEQAMGFWVKEHPDLLPFTVSATKSTTGAVIPATELAGKFIDDNKELFAKYPDAATYLLPQVGGTFDSQVYGAEMAMGIRRTKTMDEFYRDLKMAGSLDNFFQQKATHDAEIDRLKALGEPVTDENAAWQTWKDNEMALSPLMADYFAEASVRERDRDATFAQIGRMLESPLTPKNETTELFGRILKGWDEHQMFQSANAGRDEQSTLARQKESLAFDGWLQAETADNPSGKMVYNRLLKYTLGTN